uniref:Uncharacterized protein n=1 Tax=Triticum urartu TaxID=4572 RepID=A0A8R7UAV2_TRIUA
MPPPVPGVASAKAARGPNSRTQDVVVSLCYNPKKWRARKLNLIYCLYKTRVNWIAAERAPVKMALHNIGASNKDDALYRCKMPRILTEMQSCVRHQHEGTKSKQEATYSRNSHTPPSFFYPKTLKYTAGTTQLLRKLLKKTQWLLMEYT